MIDEIRILEGTLAKLEVKPGDTLVLMCDRHLSQQNLVRMFEQMKTHFPDMKCLVLDGGMKLGVVLKASAA